jgi:hypothetical protein
MPQHGGQMLMDFFKENCIFQKIPVSAMKPTPEPAFADYYEKTRPPRAILVRPEKF